MHETPKPPSGSSRLIMAVVGLVAGSVLGAFAAGFVQDTAEKAAQAQVRQDDGLELQVAELAKQIAALRAQMAKPAEPAPQTAPVPQPLADAELRAAIDGLTAALRDVLDVAPPVPEDVLVIPPPDASRREALAQQLNHDPQGLRNRHLFWTDRELLDTYGAPDFITAQDGVEQWSYEFPSGAAGFAMHLHRVIEVYSN